MSGFILCGTATTGCVVWTIAEIPMPNVVTTPISELHTHPLFIDAFSKSFGLCESDDNFLCKRYKPRRLTWPVTLISLLSNEYLILLFMKKVF